MSGGEGWRGRRRDAVQLYLKAEEPFGFEAEALSPKRPRSSKAATGYSRPQADITERIRILLK